MRGKKGKKRVPSKSCYSSHWQCFLPSGSVGEYQKQSQKWGKGLRRVTVPAISEKCTQWQKAKIPDSYWQSLDYDSLRTTNGYICLWQCSRGIKGFQRSSREGGVWGCSQGKVWMMLIDTRFPRESSKGEELIHLFFILLRQKTRCNLPKGWLPKVSW